MRDEGLRTQSSAPRMWRGTTLSAVLHGLAVGAAIVTTVSIWPASHEPASPSEPSEPAKVFEVSLEEKAQEPPTEQDIRWPGSRTNGDERSPRAFGDTGFAAVMVFVNAEPEQLGARDNAAPPRSTETAVKPEAAQPEQAAPKRTPVPIIARIEPRLASTARTVRTLEPRFNREDATPSGGSKERLHAGQQAALARYRRAAEAGRQFARYNVALAHLHGRGTPTDPAAATAELRKAAMAGYVPAMLRLAELSMTDIGATPDAIEAAAWYRVASAVGSRTGSQAAAILDTQLDLQQRAAARKRAIALQSSLSPSRPRNWRDLDNALHSALRAGDEVQVARLLEDGADGNLSDEDGRNGLIAAAWRGFSRISRMLIDAGINADSADNAGRTALMWSSLNGHEDLSAFLAAKSSAVDAVDQDGLTALMRAAWNGHAGVVRLLVQAGANPELRDPSGATAADRARLSGDPATMQALR